MGNQFEFHFPNEDPRMRVVANKSFDPELSLVIPEGGTTEATIEEIAYGWREDVRNSMYQKMIGQPPRSNLSEKDIALAILNPEQERARVIAENRDEDHDDVTRTNRGTPKKD